MDAVERDHAQPRAPILDRSVGLFRAERGYLSPTAAAFLGLDIMQVAGMFACETPARMMGPPLHRAIRP